MSVPSTVVSNPAWRRPLIWLGLFTAIGLLNAFHFYLNQVANGRPGDFAPRLVEELTAAWSAGLLLLSLITTIRRIHRQPSWIKRYASHLSALLAFSLLHTRLIWGSRLIAFPLLGLGRYDYGAMPWRYAMEFPSDVWVYTLCACLVWLVDHYRANRARELRAAHLESALSAARLEALRLQLNPHFLFNALNAVSAIMYEQPRAADEMLARIGELLRATLGANTQEHTLADELRLLELYLDIQRARFGERLHLRMQIAPGLDAVRVPFLVLCSRWWRTPSTAAAAGRQHHLPALRAAADRPRRRRHHGPPRKRRRVCQAARHAVRDVPPPPCSRPRTCLAHRAPGAP